MWLSTNKKIKIIIFIFSNISKKWTNDKVAISRQGVDRFWIQDSKSTLNSTMRYIIQKWWKSLQGRNYLERIFNSICFYGLKRNLFSGVLVGVDQYFILKLWECAWKQVFAGFRDWPTRRKLWIRMFDEFHDEILQL
jgi:hypothetical protein